MICILVLVKLYGIKRYFCTLPSHIFGIENYLPVDVLFENFSNNGSSKKPFSKFYDIGNPIPRYTSYHFET